MALVSGSVKSGALYQAQTTLPTGKHSFYFVFTNSEGSWADPVSPTVYAGPNVGANAQPVPPGTLITPPSDLQNGSDAGYDPN